MRPLLCPQLNLERESSRPPLWVSMESFFELSFWIAEELQDLISEYELREANQYRENGVARSINVPLPK